MKILQLGIPSRTSRDSGRVVLVKLKTHKEKSSYWLDRTGSMTCFAATGSLVQRCELLIEVSEIEFDGYVNGLRL